MSPQPPLQKPSQPEQYTVFLKPSFAIVIEPTGLSVRVTPSPKN
jgi:hypothetical protein